MKHSPHLDAKTIELAGIAASVAGGCRPCLEYHFNKAMEIGCELDQIIEVISLAKMIRQRPIMDISEFAEQLTNKYKPL